MDHSAFEPCRRAQTLQRVRLFFRTLGLLLLVAVAPSPSLAQELTGYYDGYVGALGYVLRGGKRIWVERTPEGTKEIGLDEPDPDGTPAADQLNLFSAQVFEAGVYENEKQAFDYYNARDPRPELLSRSDYLARQFRSTPENAPLTQPPLEEATTWVLVNAASKIKTSSDILLHQFRIKPNQQAPAGTTYLVSRAGEILRATTGSFGFKSGFLNAGDPDNPFADALARDCPGPDDIGPSAWKLLEDEHLPDYCWRPSAMVSFEVCRARPLDLIRPIAGVEIDSASRTDGRVKTQANGHFSLRYSYWYTDGAYARDNLWAFLNYKPLDPRIKGRGVQLIERCAPAGGQGYYWGDLRNIALDTSLLVGPAQFVNEPRSEFPLGADVPAVIPIDDAGGRTQYVYVKPVTVPPPPPPPGTPRPPVEHDFTDRGLLQQISRKDLADTDLYVFDLAGNRLIERRGLNLFEPEGVKCDDNACWVDPGQYLAKFQLQAYVKVTAETSVKVIVVNRATGYTGTSRGRIASNTGPGTPGLSYIQLERDIKLRPPNLEVKVERQRTDITNQQVENTIGFEGSGLVSDQALVITTNWKDWDGSALPVTLPGLTGRIARVVGVNQLGSGVTDASGKAIANFPVNPGETVTNIRLPSKADIGYFYLHVSGQQEDRAPDFSELDAGAGVLQYRPSNYAPFKVGIFQKPDDWDPNMSAADLADAARLAYRWVYRPEMQFSLVDLEVRNVNVNVVGESEPVDIIADRNAVISGDVESVDVIYNLFEETRFPELERFGGERTYLIGGTGEPQVVQVGADGEVHLDRSVDPNQQGEVDASDFVAIWLVQEGDEGNVLASYGLSYGLEMDPAEDEPPPPFRCNPATSSRLSADYAGLVDYSAVATRGFDPVETGSIVKFTAENAGINPAGDTAYTDAEGLATIQVSTPTEPGECFRITAKMEQVMEKGQLITLDKPLESHSADILIVPGDPYALTLTPEGTYDVPADGQTIVDVSAAAVDQFGNPIDGVPVSWESLGEGRLIQSDPVMLNGIANARILTPDIPGPHSLLVTVGKLEKSLQLITHPIIIALQSNVLQPVPLTSQVAELTATFSSPAGLADTTRVFWTASRGRLFDVDSTVNKDCVGEQCTYTANAKLAMEVSADYVSHVYAMTMSSVSNRVTIAVSPQAIPNTVVKLKNSALVAPTDEESQMEVIEPIPPAFLGYRTLRDETLDGQVRTLDTYFQTTIDIKGPPNTEVRLEMEPGLAQHLEFVGLLPGDKIMLDSSGGVPLGGLFVRVKPSSRFSKPPPCLGEGSSNCGFVDDRMVSGLIYVRLPGGQVVLPGKTYLDAEVPIVVVSMTLAETSMQFLYGLVTGDESNDAAAAGAFLSSFTDLSSVRDLGVMSWNYAVHGKSPDGLMVMANVAGFLPAGPVVDLIKRILKRFKSNAARRALWSFLMRAQKSGSTSTLTEALPFFKYVDDKGDDFIEKFGKVIRHDDGIERLVRIHAHPNGAKFLDEVALVAGNPALGEEVGLRMVKLMSETNPVVFDELLADPARASRALAETFKKFKDVEAIKVALQVPDARIFNPDKYSRLRMMEDFGALSEVPGFEKLVARFNNPDLTAGHGFKYELQVPAQIARGEIAQFSNCAVVGLSVLAIDNTDIDALLDCGGNNKRIQIKRSRSAFKTKSKIKIYLDRINPDGDYSDTLYAVPSETFQELSSANNRRDSIIRFLREKGVGGDDGPLVAVPEFNPRP